MAIGRVKRRVSEGGHHIPEDVIIRRYYKGIKNLFSFYLKKVNFATVIDNSKSPNEIIITKSSDGEMMILNQIKYNFLLNTTQNEV